MFLFHSKILLNFWSKLSLNVLIKEGKGAGFGGGGGEVLSLHRLPVYVKFSKFLVKMIHLASNALSRILPLSSSLGSLCFISQHFLTQQYK